MKGLFIHFFDLAPQNGISKKVLYQVAALTRGGIDMELCRVSIDERGNQQRMCGNKVIEDFGNGFKAKYLKWFRFKSITKYILDNNIRFVYVRSFYNNTPPLLKMFRVLRKNGVKVIMEFPTYPYDNETSGAPFKYRFLFYINRLFRNCLPNYVDRIVTFTDKKSIHGVKTICLSNGIDFEMVTVKKSVRDNSEVVNLIAVAEIHFWHGFDRLINGLGVYYKTQSSPEVHFNIIGDGFLNEVDKLKTLVKDNKIEKYVHFYGFKHGEELDSLFEEADFGVASLARHRSGITKIKTLKNREYAARGIPFIYSETDDDFDNMPYVIKAPADETPIDIQNLLKFYKNLNLTPLEIRNSIIDTLSWDVQMKRVIAETFKTDESS